MPTSTEIMPPATWLGMVLWLTILYILVPLQGVYSQVETTYFDQSTLEQYDDMHNADFFTYQLAAASQELVWNYKASRSSEDCPQRKTHIYLQHGSFPLVIENNQTFPGNFSMHRTNLRNATIPTNDTMLTFSLLRPQAGTWFSLAFLDKESSESVHKITDKDCQYFVQLNVTRVGQNEVDSIKLNQLYRIHLDQIYIQKFYVADSVWKYDVSITSCTWNKTELQSCPIRIFTSGGNWPVPYRSGTYSSNCTNAGIESCSLTVRSPEVNLWHYLVFVNKTTNDINIHFIIRTHECSSSPIITQNSSPSHAAQTHHNTTLNLITKNQPVFNSTITNSTDPPSTAATLPFVPITKRSSCPTIHKLSRVENSDMIGHSLFIAGVNYKDEFNISNSGPVMARFDLSQVKDIGSTLKFTASISVENLNLTLQNVSVDICIQRQRIPANGSDMFCSADVIRIHTSSLLTDLYFPYPEPGVWFIAMKATCYNDSLSTPEPCIGGHVIVPFRLFTNRCFNGECENDGVCRLYFANSYPISVCHCEAKYRGFSCGDGSQGASHTDQLGFTLMLTLSNLFFVPAIGVALYRRYISEAVVYLANMFFSTFYHACDMGPFSLYRLCIMPYDVLQFTDFFLSILSFWVTLLAATEVAMVVRAPLHMLGAILLAMGVKWSRALLVNVIPIGVGVGLLLLTWLIKGCRRRRCYPPRRRLLWVFLGCIPAVVGLCIFGLLETDDNYPYTHSTWHVCMSTSIIFLLPKRKLRVKEETSEEAYMIELGNNDDDSSSSLLPASSTNDPHHPDDLHL